MSVCNQNVIQISFKKRSWFLRDDGRLTNFQSLKTSSEAKTCMHASNSTAEWQTGEKKQLKVLKDNQWLYDLVTSWPLHTTIPSQRPMLSHNHVAIQYKSHRHRLCSVQGVRQWMARHRTGSCQEFLLYQCNFTFQSSRVIKPRKNPQASSIKLLQLIISILNC